MKLPAQRPLILLAVAVVLGGAAYFYLGQQPPESNSRTTPGAVAAARAGQKTTTPLVALNLDRLKRAPSEIVDAPDRDLFRFRPKAPPPPPPRPVAPPPPPAVVAVPQPPPGPPPPPPIQLKFIGLVDAPAQKGRVAVLSDTRGSVFYGREGDIIDGRYRVLKINPESAELAYVDGRGRQVIRLSGQ